jgi:DNA repair protein RadD
MSTSLYVQMLGRGTRKAEGKDNCLVLDFAGNIMTHGPVDSVRVRTKKKGGELDEAEAPTKICPACDSYMPAAIHQCTNCGHVWPIDEDPKHSGSADLEAPVLTSEIVKKWLPVKVRVHNRNTGKNGKPDSVCVEYMCGFASYREFICPEHTGFASAKAGQWWRAMGGSAPSPKTVSDMLRRMDERELQDVESVMVIPDGKYMRINGYIRSADGAEIDHKLRLR